MTLDVRSMYSSDQAILLAADEAGENTLDQNRVRPLGGGSFTILRLMVGTAFAGLDSGMRAYIQSDSENTFSTTPREEASSPILLPARLTAGAIIDIPLPRGNPDLDWQAISRIWYDLISEVATAGTISAGLI